VFSGFAWLWSIVIALVIGVTVAFVRPTWMLRAGLWLLGHSLFWLRTFGRDRVPAQGSVILVCHRLEYLDWLWLWLAAPRRVRCFLIAGWTRRRVAQWVIRWTGAIAVDAEADAQALTKALQLAGDALKNGEAIVLFTERGHTRGGAKWSFSELLRALCQSAAVPVVPVVVDQPEGSRFGVQHGQMQFDRPRVRPHLVEVTFGQPLGAEVEAGAVLQAVQHLSADAAQSRSDRFLPVHRDFVRRACKHPFRPCIIDSTNKSNPLNYGKTLAGGLCLMRHLKPLIGDAPMVAVWLPPGTGGALCNLALALLRRTSVNLNYTAGPDSIRSAIEQCQIKHVLTAKRFTARVPLEPIPGVEFIYLDELMPKISQGEKTRAFLRVLLSPAWLMERTLGLHHHTVDDLATVIFSSGSTGDPKGVMLTHRNVAANVESMVQLIQLRPTDRALGVLPFFHSFGYTVTLWVPMTRGASAVYHADPRQAKEIGDLCREFGCTIFLITPTFLRFCLKKCNPPDFKSVRILMCGAEKLPQSFAAEFHQKFDVVPLEGYGCTELSPAAAANLPDEEVDGCVQLRNKSGTIGPPLPGVAARVVDPDTKVPLPLGQEGMLLIRGPNSMKGYLHKQELTARVLQTNEYETGDMARLDEDGHITLTGRLSRFAKIGGEMVPLEKIEEELLGLLGGDGSERPLAVAAVPDEKRGERLVVLHLTTVTFDIRQLVKQLGERGLPNLWVPGERDFFAIESLPLLGSGKLDLRRIKEVAIATVRGG